MRHTYITMVTKQPWKQKKNMKVNHQGNRKISVYMYITMVTETNKHRLTKSGWSQSYLTEWSDSDDYVSGWVPLNYTVLREGHDPRGRLL